MARIITSAPDGILSQTLPGTSLGIVDSIKPSKRTLAGHTIFGWRQALNAPARDKVFHRWELEI
jgi:hypothetical protein